MIIVIIIRRLEIFFRRSQIGSLFHFLSRDARFKYFVVKWRPATAVFVVGLAGPPSDLYNRCEVDLQCLKQTLNWIVKVRAISIKYQCTHNTIHFILTANKLTFRDRFGWLTYILLVTHKRCSTTNSN